MSVAFVVTLALFTAPGVPPDPPEWALANFPAPAVVRQWLDFADELAAGLCLRARTHGWGGGLRELADEARELRHTWRLLALAQGEAPEWFEPGRLDARRELARRLGPRDYLRGLMPPPVPLRAFARKD